MVVLFDVSHRDTLTTLDVDRHTTRTIQFSGPAHEGLLDGPFIVGNNAIVIQGGFAWSLPVERAGTPTSLGPACDVLPATSPGALWISEQCPWATDQPGAPAMRLREVRGDGKVFATIELPPAAVPLAIGSRALVVVQNPTQTVAGATASIIDRRTGHVLRSFTGYDVVAASQDVLFTTRAGRPVDTLRLIEAHTGRVRRLTLPALTNVSAASFSPDGRHVVLAAHLSSNAPVSAGLFIVDTRTGTTNPVPGSASPEPPNGFRAFAWSADGTWLFFRKGARGTRTPIGVYHLGSARSSELHPGVVYYGLGAA